MAPKSKPLTELGGVDAVDGLYRAVVQYRASGQQMQPHLALTPLPKLVRTGRGAKTLLQFKRIAPGLLHLKHERARPLSIKPLALSRAAPGWPYWPRRVVRGPLAGVLGWRGRCAFRLKGK